MIQVFRISFFKNAGGPSVSLWLGISVKGFAGMANGICTGIGKCHFRVNGKTDL
jgi:hypothetical protein